MVGVVYCLGGMLGGVALQSYALHVLRVNYPPQLPNIKEVRRYAVKKRNDLGFI